MGFKVQTECLGKNMLNLIVHLSTVQTNVLLSFTQVDHILYFNTKTSLHGAVLTQI